MALPSPPSRTPPTPAELEENSRRYDEYLRARAEWWRDHPRPRFCLTTDIAGGAAVGLREGPSWTDRRPFKFCITWPGAALGMIWRNLLGPLYVPFSPERRFDLHMYGVFREKHMAEGGLHG